MTPRNIISMQPQFDELDPDRSVQFNFIPTCQQPINVNMGPAVGFYNPCLGHVPSSCRFIPGYVYPPYMSHAYQFPGTSWGYINAMPGAGAYPYFPQPIVPAHLQPQIQASCPRQMNLVPGIPSFQPLSQHPMQTGFYRRRDQVMQSEMQNTSFLETSRLNEMEDVVDEHVGMRLDIDGMSYEELLDLEVRIGDVQTGLSKDFIIDNLKTHMHEVDGVSSDSCASWADICIICQGEYDGKDCIGTLDCGHSYHSDCIKQWLKLKNQCPICKQVALTNR